MNRLPLDSRSRQTTLLASLSLACGLACACRPEPSATLASTAPAPPVSVPEPAAPAPVAAATTALPDFSDPSWTRVTSRAGTYIVCWRSTSGSVPRNQDFELEVWVLKDGAPVSDALLTVQGWMPEHGHGMLRQPKAETRPDGSYRVAGMLLHMRGHWQLFFEVLEGSLAETAECALDL